MATLLSSEGLSSTINRLGLSSVVLSQVKLTISSDGSAPDHHLVSKLTLDGSSAMMYKLAVEGV
jgi:hypothetical protein